MYTSKGHSYLVSAKFTLSSIRSLAQWSPLFLLLVVRLLLDTYAVPLKLDVDWVDLREVGADVPLAGDDDVGAVAAAVPLQFDIIQLDQ